MPRPGFTPSLDPLEARLTLSTLTTCEYQHVRADLRQALTVADRTGDLRQASRILSHAAAQVPFSRASLLPLWKLQAAAVADGAARSVVRRDLFLALDRHLNRGVQVGAIQVRGPAARQIARPEVQALNNSIVVINLTGLDLQVAITEQPGGRVISQDRLSRGTSESIPTPATESLPLPIRYQVKATEVDGPAIAEAEVRVGQTVAFLRDLPGNGIVAKVYAPRF